MHTLIEIIFDHLRYRRQIPKLAKSDLVKTYKGAALGWAWALIRPSMTIAVYYFTLSVGLRAGQPKNGMPYFLWLLAGVVPWFYMSGVFTGGAGCIRQYSYLVTKIRFPVSVIPTFFSLSQLVTHSFLVITSAVIFMFMGFAPDIYWLQIPVYTAMMFLFFDVWALFAGILSSYSKDFQQLVRSMGTVLFWLSGTIYEVSQIHIPKVRAFMLMNPMTFIINGYRNAMIYKVWIWEEKQALFNFAIVYTMLGILTLIVYKKSKKSIADVM